MSARPDINVIRAKYNLAPMGTVDQPTIVSPNFGCDIVEHCQKIFPDSGNLSFDLDGRNFYLDLSRGLQSYYAGVEMPPNWTEEHKRYIQLPIAIVRHRQPTNVNPKMNRANSSPGERGRSVASR